MSEPGPRPSVVVVEDEKDLANTLGWLFEREGFQVRVVHSGRDGLDALRREPLADLVVLDLMLPDVSGVEICRQLRTAPRTRALPIVMLTARGDEYDRVVGFEAGADDYVVKPFSPRELMLRVRAVLRRSHPVDATPKAPEVFGRLRIEADAHRAFVDDVETVLTALEFRLLSTFLARKGRVQTRDTLLSDVWGIEADITTRTVDTHVKRLREKLGAAADYVETLRGVGYRFRDRPDA